MTALLAIASALIIGGSDFSGGIATRRDSSFTVTVWAQVWSGITALVLVAFVPSTSVATVDLVGGILAGLSGSFSFVCFYAALSRGTMSIVAPTTAVVGAMVPVLVGLVRGEEIGTSTSVGIAVALIAIVLVTRSEDGHRLDASAMALAVVAGLGFSVFFIALADTNDAAGLWPLVIARAVSIPAVIVAARVAVGSIIPRTPVSRRLAAYTGITEMIANVLLLMALRRGPLAVAAVFGSLYPVSTVILAWVFLRERLGLGQLAGVVMAVAALALVAI